MAHKTIDRRGRERFIQDRRIRHWVCQKCGGFCGHTHSPEGTTRIGYFCESCDQSTEQVVIR